MKLKSLLRVFSDIRSAIEMYALLGGLKPAVRLIIEDIELKKIEIFCEKQGLHWCSPYRIKPFNDTSKKYAHAGCLLSATSKKGTPVVFISHHSRSINSFSRHNEDPSLTGRLLGYPPCCLRFYQKNLAKAPTWGMDLTLLSKSSSIKVPYIMNISARSFYNLSLLSHFPCSTHCQASIRLARTMMRFFSRHEPDLAKKIVSKLSGLTIYTDKDGILLSHQYEHRKSEITVKSFYRTKDSMIWSELERANGRIQTFGPNHFQIGDKYYNSQSRRILIYD